MRSFCRPGAVGARACHRIMPRAPKPSRTLSTSRVLEDSPHEGRKVAPPAAAAAIENDEGFERGARVRVVAGPFAGKVGVVDDLDGKGSARVLLGLLPV